MLLTNYSVLNSNPGREIGGGGVNNIFTYYKPSTFLNFYTGGNSDSVRKASMPTGTQAPYSIVMGFVGGELSSTTFLTGVNVVSSNMYQGVGIGTSITGSGDLANSQLNLIVQLACSLLASSGLSATITGTIQMASSLAGSGNLVASLNLIANVIASINSSGTLVSNLTGTSSLSSTISSVSDLSPEGLANAVWNSLAASFNTAGTMGNKVNSAASAGDPWSTSLPSSYVDSQAGNIIGQIHMLLKDLHTIRGLNGNSPSTATPTSIIAGDIEIQITGDGENSTTMTRVGDNNFYTQGGSPITTE
jgi:hypothetical protein